MHYTLTPQTFFVAELFNPVLTDFGKYYYYLLEKQGLSHKQAVKRISAQAFFGGAKDYSSNPGDTKPPQIGLWFCGVKDKHATTRQWVCTKEKISDIEEEYFKLKYVGQSNEKIFVGKHKGNAFRVIVELNEEEAKLLKKFRAKEELCANYFGEQRFNTKSMEIADLIEREDYEGALKKHLTQVTGFDSDLSKTMKKIIKENWGKWREISESEVFKNTRKKKQFEYLIENPTDYKGAFIASEPRSVSLIIKTAQAMRFNNELNKMVKEKKPNNFETLISGRNLNLGANKAMKREIIIEPTEFEKNFRTRTLKRNTFFIAKKFKPKKLENKKYEIYFELSKGEYATIFLKFLEKWIEKNNC
ncbi:MAG: tRNA pseudouridine(13) synthase TruD [Candidatus Iainarchaeum sp.]|jgi:tRNA(Glu) U13 pseudouridine synthase TruD